MREQLDRLRDILDRLEAAVVERPTLSALTVTFGKLFDLCAELLIQQHDGNNGDGQTGGTEQ